MMHNPGYDFRRMLLFLKNADQGVTNPQILPYFVPIVAALCGCAAIEGYINAVACRTDPNWIGEARGFESIKSKISRLYALKSRPVDFRDRVFKDVLDLFSWRKKFAHPAYTHRAKQQSTKLRTIFEDFDSHFDLPRIDTVVFAFTKKVISDFDLDDVWLRRGTNITNLDVRKYDA